MCREKAAANKWLNETIKCHHIDQSITAMLCALTLLVGSFLKPYIISIGDRHALLIINYCSFVKINLGKKKHVFKVGKRDCTNYYLPNFLFLC